MARAEVRGADGKLGEGRGVLLEANGATTNDASGGGRLVAARDGSTDVGLAADDDGRGRLVEIAADGLGQVVWMGGVLLTRVGEAVDRTVGGTLLARVGVGAAVRVGVGLVTRVGDAAVVRVGGAVAGRAAVAIAGTTGVVFEAAVGRPALGLGVNVNLTGVDALRLLLDDAVVLVVEHPAGPGPVLAVVLVTAPGLVVAVVVGARPTRLLAAESGPPGRTVPA